MDDVSIGQLMHYLTIGLWISFILFILCYPMYSVAQLVSFQQSSAKIISRYGGVTANAKETVNTIGETYYHNKFSIVNTPNNQTSNYGENIPYTIHVRIPVVSNLVETNIQANTESEVRNENN